MYNYVDGELIEVDAQTAGIVVQQTSAIRIDDKKIAHNRVWSSAYTDFAKEDSTKQKLRKFIDKYGRAYFAKSKRCNCGCGGGWYTIAMDAQAALAAHNEFWLAWDEDEVAKVVYADPDNDETPIIVLYNGQHYTMGEDGVKPIANIYAKSADTFAKPIKLSLSGDATGETEFDGSADAEIKLTVATMTDEEIDAAWDECFAEE